MVATTDDFSHPIAEHQYAKEWHEYRVRGVILLFLFVGYLPFAILIDFLLDAFLEGNETLMAMAACSWLAAFGFAIWRFGSFRCPRCDEEFFNRKAFAFIRFHQPFAKKCWNCGLKKWAGE